MDVEQALLAKLDTISLPIFSGEEEFSKYLDLHECYNIYINSKFGRYPLDYVDYLTIFLATINAHESSKYTKEYKEYLKAVFDYLMSFMDRAHPLTFMDRVFSNLEAQIETQWANKRPLLATALLEAKVKELCRVLKDTIERTKQRVLNKQGMTVDELVKGRMLSSEYYDNDNDDENEEDDNEIKTNPKKLPMGWDGKPIPYWLYKLHGLDQEFNCEICGNYIYKGRREFERHFHNSRHQFGMHCLGIPNSKSFHEITLIEDAKNLWQEIQSRESLSTWKPDEDEEYEDFQGNVYNKKTYLDLVKQGLI